MSEVKDIFTIYNEVLNGNLSRFPLHTWNHPRESKETLIKLIRYIILEKNQWDRKKFCENFCYKIIVESRLNTGFMKVYSRNIFPLVTDAFPEWDIKAWELEKSRVPAYFWSEDTAAKATKWLIEERLEWSLDKVQNKISNTHFIDNNLGGMIRTLKIGAVDAVVMSYPHHDWTYLIDRAGYVLTKNDAQEIRDLYASGKISQRQIAIKFNISPSQIHLVIKDKIFK